VLPGRDPRLTLSRWVPETPPFELEERSGGVFAPRAGDAVREQHPPTAAMSETMQGGAASPQDGLDSLTQPKTPAIGDTAATAIWVSVNRPELGNQCVGSRIWGCMMHCLGARRGRRNGWKYPVQLDRLDVPDPEIVSCAADAATLHGTPRSTRKADLALTQALPHNQHKIRLPGRCPSIPIRMGSRSGTDDWSYPAYAGRPCG
jgi:hypothetical protein